MYKHLAVTFLIAIATQAQAQMTPVGNWHTMDEKTGELTSLVSITEVSGVLSGRIEKLLAKDSDQKSVCKECSDDRKGQPIVGLEIIRGAKKAEGKNVWESGKILDPDNGKNYTLRLTPIESGAKLEVRGSVFGIGRIQTWIRVQ